MEGMEYEKFGFVMNNSNFNNQNDHARDSLLEANQ